MTKPKRMGRPPGTGRGASDKIEVRVTPEERALWTAAATAEDGSLNLGQWIRDRCNASAKRAAK